MTKTLYLTRNGLMEPLGQSQVFSYLRGLSGDYEITLISYEKADDLKDIARFKELEKQCEELGIHWLPQRFRYTPRLIAPAIDMFRFAWLGWKEVRKGAALIHARSYIPAAVAQDCLWCPGCLKFGTENLW